MDKGKKIKTRRIKNTSFLWQTVDRFTAFLYSLLIFGKVGESMSNEDTYCRRSFLAHSFSNVNKSSLKSASHAVSGALNKNAIVRALASVGRFLAYLRLNVYGAFFTFYGLTSALVHYIMTLINGQSVMSANNLDLIITSAIITFCSIPLLMSSQSATGAICKSKMMRRIVLDFFDIPEEKLKSTKQYGGTQYVLFAVIFAIALGALAYFLNPWYMPAVLVCLVAVYLVFSNPEAGVIITITSIPFLQYYSVTKIGLITMILITSVSYLCKLIQRRRTINLSPELTMALLFSAFVFVGSMFTFGGAQVMCDAVSYVIIILGGFFLTYNLISSKKGISICTKTLTVVLVVCALIGIWDGFYNGISHRVADHVSQQLSDISSVDVMAMFDGGDAFGVMAVLVFPIIFAYAARRKSVKGAVTMIIASVIVIVACWMCTRYEIVVALIIECFLFWLLYSHRSLTVIIIAALPVSIAGLLYPYAIEHLGWPDISSILAEYMPASLNSSSVNGESVGIVLEMIFNGDLCGIGAGAHAIEAVLPAYSSSLSYSDVYSASVWLQILCWSGIFGFLSFLLFVGFLVKRSFRCFTRSSQNEDHGIGLALLCGIIVSLMLGMVTNIWINEGMMYIFWVNVGLLLSYIRESDKDHQKRIASFAHTADGTDTEIIFYK